MSESIADSYETGSTAATGQTIATDTTGTTISVGKVPYHKINQNGLSYLPQQLPSHKFQYSVWHDLRQTELHGTELHAPRVRRGPLEKEKDFYRLEEEGVPIHHSLYGIARQNHMNELEKWWDAKAINLSFQELAHDYQRKNFHRILGILNSAITVNLVSNKLTDLRQHTFPQCESLNLNQNYITSFRQLPRTPRIRCLTLTNNNVNRFSYMDRLASTPIQELTLKGNPVSFMLDYRQKVFRFIPNLRILDGIRKLPSDEYFEEENEIDNKKTCSII